MLIRKYLKEIFCCVLILGIEIFLFRAFFTDQLMFGNAGDGRFCALATEHWYKVFCGKESALDLNMFYPVSGTLAYSDMFLGMAIPHIMLRVLGFNMYSAFRLTLIMLHVFGAFSMYWLLHKKIKLNLLASIMGVILFVYAAIPNIYGHPQLFAIYFVPLLAWCILSFFQCTLKEEKIRRHIYGGISIFLFALIFYTSGYLGYFIAIYAILFGIVYVIVSYYVLKENVIKKIWIFIKKNLVECIGYGLETIFLFLPFVLIYVPISREFGDRNWAEIIDFLPTISNIFSVDARNIFYGNILTGLNFNASNSELTTGIPIITVAVCIYFLLKMKEKIYEKRFSIYIVMFLAAALNLLLILKIGTKFSGWYLIWRFLPGASSIRAVVRTNHLIAFFIAIFVAAGIDYYFKVSPKKSAINTIRNVLFLFIVISQYAWEKNAALDWSETESLAMLSEIEAPPEECQAMFAVLPKDDYTAAFSPMQLYGWEIADYFGLKNINGFSSNYPEDWLPLYDMTNPAYEIEVYNWCIREGVNLDKVYGYDLENNEWISMKSFPVMNLICNKIPNQLGVFENGNMYLLPKGYIYGPYVDLYPGEYTFIIHGDELENVLVECKKNNGEEDIDAKIMEDRNGTLQVKLHVPEYTENVELIITNKDDNNVISIKNISLDKDE